MSDKEIVSSSKEYSGFNLGAVYFLIDCGTIVYVGKSENYIKRIQQHKNIPIPQKIGDSIIRTPKFFDSYNIILLENDRQRSILEAYYILKFKPKYNIQMPSSDLQRDIIEKLMPIQESCGIVCCGTINCKCKECLLNAFIYDIDNELINND